MRCAHAVQVDDSFLSQFGIAAEDKETLIRISSNAVRLHLLLRRCCGRSGCASLASPACTG
jgi:hypothetical protein